MLDRVDAGPQGCRDAVRADGVRRDRTSDPMRLIDDCLRFGVREVDPAVQHAVGGEVVAPVAVILEPVGAVLHLLAHREPRVVDAVHRLHAVGQLELPVVGGDRIHAGRGHRARRGEHPRTGDLTAIDRVLDVDIGIHRAFGLEIANRREAVLEREPRVTRGEDRTIWGRLLEELVFVLLRGDVALEQQVRVRVDMPGSTVIWLRSMTRALGACPWICARGPTALMRSSSIRMPTLVCTCDVRPSINRPALTRTVCGGVWAPSAAAHSARARGESERTKISGKKTGR